MMMCIQNLVLFCQFVLKILSKNQNLTSIDGRHSVANLRKTKIYNTNLDLVTDNVYTNFGLILSICSQDIEQKPNFDINQGRNSLANLQKTMIYNTKVDLVNDTIGPLVAEILKFENVYARTYARTHRCRIDQYTISSP